MTDQPKTETLRQECERILSESKALAYAVAVHDYETGLRLAINAERRFHAASTMKVAILLALGKAIDDERIRPNDTLHVRNRFRSALDRRSAARSARCRCERDRAAARRRRYEGARAKF